MKKVLAFLSGTVVSHGLSALAGLLLTRWLSVDQYAVYTVVIVLTGAMTVLTMGGVNIAFSTIVGRTWPDRLRAAQALEAALRERRIISIVVLPLFLLTAAWLLHRAKADTGLIVALLGLLVLQWHFDMRSKISDQILLFARRALGLQMLDTAMSLLRFVLVLAAQGVGLLSVMVATLIGTVASGLRVPLIQRWTRQELPAQAVDALPEDRQEIRSVTRRQMPVELFYCFQSQIALFIIALSGTTAATASFGALGRIAQLFVPITMLVSSYAIPRFSQEKHKVLRALFGWSLLGLLPGVAMVLIAKFLPGVLLWLIGPNYANLQAEVFVATLGSALVLFAGTLWRLAANRGWNRWVLMQIPVFALWCAVAPFLFDFSRLIDVLWFQLGFPLALLAATAMDLWSAWRRGELQSGAMAAAQGGTA